LTEFYVKGKTVILVEGIMENVGQEPVSIDVGKSLKHLREERGVSMRSLARASGLSANALSMIERGLTSPSVTTLNKLAVALEVPVTAFFRYEPERSRVVHIKSSERMQVPIDRGVWEGLGTERFSGRVDAFMVTLESGAGSNAHGMMHSGSEFVYCMRGTIDYEVDGMVYRLQPGDALVFAAQLMHKWRNPESGDANAMVIIFAFEDGERPAEFHFASASPGNSTNRGRA
jgi:transcriptional regulator with XRE-family HTH domain